MKKTIELGPGDLSSASYQNEEIAKDVLYGLTKKPLKELSSKFFYNSEGSELFTAITQLEEYYLTDCEKEILERNRARLVDHMGNEGHLIELGAGDGQKTKIILRHVCHSRLNIDYVPIDISKSAVDQLVTNLENELPDLSTRGIVSDYEHGIRWIKEQDQLRNFVLFLGSSIGNFNPEMARQFLLSLWHALNDGDFVLIGFDMLKPVDVLEAAYNDSEGITKRFNLNLLDRINAELNADFNPKQFQFEALFNPEKSVVESYLISTKKQQVHIKNLDLIVPFAPWEPIRTEYSHKYSQAMIEELSNSTGFKPVEFFFDEKRYFCDALLRVDKALL